MAAAEFKKEGATIEMVDRTAERPGRSQYSNNVYIKLSTTPKWTRGDCNEDWVALQNNDEIGFSIAMTALVSGKKVIVRVNDSLPKIGGTHCQISTIAIKK